MESRMVPDTVQLIVLVAGLCASAPALEVTRPAGIAPRRSAHAEPATRDAPPPARIPAQVFDVRRMAWFRTRWQEQPVYWPPAVAAKRPFTRRELTAVSVHAAIVLIGALLLLLDFSFARLTVPTFGAGTEPTMWPAVLFYVALSAAWLTLRLRVRAQRWALVLWLATLVIASLEGAVVLCRAEQSIEPFDRIARQNESLAKSQLRK